MPYLRAGTLDIGSSQDIPFGIRLARIERKTLVEFRSSGDHFVGGPTPGLHHLDRIKYLLTHQGLRTRIGNEVNRGHALHIDNGNLDPLFIGKAVRLRSQGLLIKSESDPFAIR